MINFLQRALLLIITVGTFTVFSSGVVTSSAKAETTECTQIMTLPAIITVQGIYCFKTNLVTSITTGNAIEIQTSNVTIDMNGFKLGGSTAGTGTQANGFYANGQKNITIKNGTIRGFYFGIYLQDASGSGHLIEKVRSDGNRLYGFHVQGDNNIIRNNHVTNIGSGTVSDSAIGIAVSLASNTIVSNNVVSSIFETLAAYGIQIQGSSRVEVSGNSIFDIKDATSKYGIYFSSSSDLTLFDNRIVNPGVIGTVGIIDSGGNNGIDCIENTIRGYTGGQTGCDYTSGNHIN